jgi:TonB family protein
MDAEIDCKLQSNLSYGAVTMHVIPQFTTWLIFFVCVSVLQAQQKQAYMNVNRVVGGAVDAKGLRHSTRDYPSGHPPWLDDCISVIAPKYPLEDLRLHHEGSGLFRLVLDLHTGRVKQVFLIKSTGFSSLDRSAMMAFREWRWKPGKWKEVEMSTGFHRTGSGGLTPGALKIPHQ